MGPKKTPAEGATATKTTPAKKSVKKEGKKERRRTRHETFSVHIYKVLKQVHNDTGSQRSQWLYMSIHNKWLKHQTLFGAFLSYSSSLWESLCKSFNKEEQDQHSQQ